MRRKLSLLGFIFMAAALSSCANHYTADSIQDPYGFFSGIWHGMIFPFALIANLISWFVGLIGISLMQSIEIIGRPNTGLWYYVGFFFGLSISAGSTSN